MMARRTGRWIFGWLMFLATALPGGVASLQGQAPPLPEGKGVESVRTHCLACHDSRLIVQQRLTHEQWVGVVEKMIRWGTRVPPAEKPDLVGYLAEQFGASTTPIPAMSALPQGAGFDRVRTACLGCHGPELILEQRLTRDEWRAVVEKMIRWGAPLSRESVEHVIDYLARYFRQERR